jgi:thioredoxin-dependent peroxiredoxin
MVKLKIGDKAPDFSLQSNTDEKVSLSQFLGVKNVVVFFYPMDESPVCSREAEAFKEKYEAFKKLGAEVIGISSQSSESHKAFANHHNLPYILLSDVEGAVRKLYGVASTLGVVPGRVTFVIDKEGVIKYLYSSQLQPARHAEEALRALQK